MIPLVDLKPDLPGPRIPIEIEKAGMFFHGGNLFRDSGRFHIGFLPGEEHENDRDVKEEQKRKALHRILSVVNGEKRVEKSSEESREERGEKQARWPSALSARRADRVTKDLPLYTRREDGERLCAPSIFLQQSQSEHDRRRYLDRLNISAVLHDVLVVQRLVSGILVVVQREIGVDALILALINILPFFS